MCNHIIINDTRVGILEGSGANVMERFDSFQRGERKKDVVVGSRYEKR